jgi:SAM-dependent methyltransferase
MKPASRVKPPSPDFLGQGKVAFRAGRFHLAAEAYAKARDADPRNPVPLFNLASAKERLGDIDEAAALLTQALRLRPNWFDPAQRLARLLARYALQAPGALDPRGLLAAFAFDRIDLQPLAAGAIAHLQVQSPLGEAIARAEAGRGLEAARDWLVRRTEKTLSQPLLLSALSHGINKHPGLERLLTAMRRVLLLDVPVQRFEDKALTGFVMALIRQCLNNEHVFAVSAEETEALSRLKVDWAALQAGAPDEARRLMLLLLYWPHDALDVRLSPEICRVIRPRALGDLLAAQFSEDEQEVRFAADIPALGVIGDATSRKVAAQYEAYPYPRWTSLQMPREGSARAMLEGFVPPEKLGFLNGPFRVLIAGAGTGKHAIAAGVRYGANAQVLAVDLSRRSLAYAKARAARFEAGNLDFAQADLQNIPDETGPFDIIEAVGVLHHMAEPFKGWQALIRLLRPGGLMLAGLYSAVSRQGISEMRRDPAYPGPACDDEAARSFRAGLLERGSELTSSYDFYTLSNFRDLVLHEHERPIFLSEVEAFLEQNGLIFRGFSLPPLITAAFLTAYPEEKKPGSLASWAKFEEKHARTFDAMYQIWCEKT